MKIHHCFFCLIILLCVNSFTSCTDEKYSLGSDLVDPSAHLTLIDTCTMEMETIMADSIQTSAKDIALVGRYRDKYFGLTSAYSYMTFATCESPSLADNSAFDSITITLHTSSAYYGDTMQSMDFSIHQLKKNVTLGESGTLFNINSVEYENTPLASLHFKRKPISSKTYEFRLADKLGQDFFNKLKTNDEVMEEDNFDAYFHGLAFVPSSKENAAIVGFMANDTAIHINLYYHYTDQVKETGVFTFSIGGDGEKTNNPLLQFNEIQYDWSFKLFADLRKNKMELPSSLSNNMVYVSNLHGLAVRIKYPYLNELGYVTKYGEITNSNLILTPINDSYNAKTLLPSTLNIYTLDYTNATLSSINEGTTTTLQTGNLQTDYTYGENTNYTFNINTYLKSQIYNTGVYRENIEIINPSTTEYRTVVFGDSRHSTSAMKTKLYYLMYDGSSK